MVAATPHRNSELIMIDKDDTLEISQVGNGFIVRRASGRWFNEDRDARVWEGAPADYLVFRTMSEMQCWLSYHFTHRARVATQDILPPAAKADKKAA